MCECMFNYAYHSAFKQKKTVIKLKYFKFNLMNLKRRGGGGDIIRNLLDKYIMKREKYIFLN